MKHAFLIMAHDNYEQLKMLIQSLDNCNNDIYIHIDRKCKSILLESLSEISKESRTYVFQEYNIYWGDYSQTECEIFLMEQAFKNHYDYYHLLSGADLMLVGHNDFQSFFEANKGKEFINIDNDQLDDIFYEWFQVYHPLQKYIRLFRNRLIQLFFWKSAALLICLQKRIGINRTRNQNITFQKGANWFSITNELVAEVLKKKEWIRHTFSLSRSSDEMFIQTILVNSELKQNHFTGLPRECQNLRYIDWNRGNPYIFKEDDYEILLNSKCLFARKFDINTDRKIVECFTTGKYETEMLRSLER